MNKEDLLKHERAKLTNYLVLMNETYETTVVLDLVNESIQSFLNHTKNKVVVSIERGSVIIPKQTGFDEFMATKNS